MLLGEGWGDCEERGSETPAGYLSILPLSVARGVLCRLSRASGADHSLSGPSCGQV